jgi:uncharacterized protein (TIGR02117 family)
LKKFKKFRRFLVRIGLGFLAVAIIGAFTPTKWFYLQQSDCNLTIYVSNVNNFHTEIMVPVTNRVFDWRQHLDVQQLGRSADRYEYLSFGWGDKQFFMNAAFDPISIFDVLFIPGPSVMHVWGRVQPKLNSDSDIKIRQVNLSKSQYLKLVQFINNSFDRSVNNKVTYLRQGLYADSGFYNAKGTYSAMRTCNAWTAEALRIADVNTPVWAALAPAVMKQIDCNCDRFIKDKPDVSNSTNIQSRV